MLKKIEVFEYNYLKKFLNIWPNVLFLAGSLFCVITPSSSVNLIGVLITGFGETLPVHLLPFTLEWAVCLFWSLLWSFVKSVALDARFGVTGRSCITLFNENALPPNSERAWLILFEISGFTDKLVTLPYFGRFLSSFLPWLQKKSKNDVFCGMKRKKTIIIEIVMMKHKKNSKEKNGNNKIHSKSQWRIEF